jgi:uroporphyrinogen decarboxylase
MGSRQRIRNLIARTPADRCGLWLGDPKPETWSNICAFTGQQDHEAIRRGLGDDLRWIGCWGMTDGSSMFGVHKHALGDAGPLAHMETVAEVEAWPHWPDPAKADVAATVAALRAAGDVYRASGLWTCFYHNIMDLMGFETYMMRMHTHPAVVEAITNRVCQFYYDANERLFAAGKGEIDAFFFGNDFGTQLDLICSPKQFDRFIMPWFRRFTEQGHRHGLQVMLHSCGSIHRVIPRLIDAGVDALHPLQARAANMDAATLARDFKDRITFIGGVDTQDLLVNGTPQQIRDDVRRVRDLLGPNLIVSPSHEAVLPNVPPANLVAMAEAALAA